MDNPPRTPEWAEARFAQRDERALLDPAAEGAGRRHDRLLLGDLRAEITIVGRLVSSDDGERDIVPDAGCGLRRLEIAAGAF